MAMSFAWGGHADADLAFTKFFNGDHTLAFRFMPQYPDSYINAVVGHRSTAIASPDGPEPPAPFFVVGQGAFSDADNSPTLFLRIGTVEQTFSVPMTAGLWHHVAVVRQGDNFRIVYQGKALSRNLAVPNLQAPANTALRFGSTAAWEKMAQKLPAQFYGLLDDVAIFSRALTSAELAELSTTAGTITGLEKDLLATWTFPAKLPPLPSKLPATQKLLEGNSATAIVPVSFNHTDAAADAKHLPQPLPAHRVHLPCAKGQIVWIAQDPSMIGQSHRGRKNFIYDLKAVTLPKNVDLTLPNKPPVQLDVPFRSPVAGDVLFVNGSHPSGPGETNEMWTTHGADRHLFWRYLHWTQNSQKVAVGDHVSADQELAVIGNSGEGLDNTHLHYGLLWFPTGTLPPADAGVSVPVGFKDYFILRRTKLPNGAFQDKWEAVDFGVPKRGDTVTWGTHP